MYRKNTSGQFICFQGVDATTGGIKSGVTWTIRRDIDGTFAAATGTATEDGSTGWYKFAMSQADTNGNNVAFNFTGTGAVPQTVNILTDGSPPDVNLKNAAGAAVTLDSNNVLNVSTKYLGGTLQTARDIGLSVLLSSGTGTGQISLASGLVDITQTAADKVWGTAARTLTAGTNIVLPAGALANITAWTVAITGNITGNLSGSVGSVTGAVGSVTGNVGGNVVGSVASVSGAVGSVTGLTASDLGAIKTQTDKFAFTVANQVDSNVLDWKSATAPAMTGDAFARLGAPAGASIAADIAAIPAAVWAVTMEGTFTAIKYMKLFASALLGKASGLATTNAKYRDTGDTKDRIDAVVDSDGNRTSVTLDGS